MTVLHDIDKCGLDMFNLLEQGSEQDFWVEFQKADQTIKNAVFCLLAGSEHTEAFEKALPDVEPLYRKSRPLWCAVRGGREEHVRVLFPLSNIHHSRQFFAEEMLKHKISDETFIDLFSQMDPRKSVDGVFPVEHTRLPALNCDTLLLAAELNRERIFHFLRERASFVNDVFREDEVDKLLSIDYNYFLDIIKNFQTDFSIDTWCERFQMHWRERCHQELGGEKLPPPEIDRFIQGMEKIYSSSSSYHQSDISLFNKNIGNVFYMGFMDLFETCAQKTTKPFFLNHALGTLVLNDNFELFDFLLTTQDKCCARLNIFPNNIDGMGNISRVIKNCLDKRPAFYDRLAQSSLAFAPVDFLDAGLLSSNKKAFFDGTNQLSNKKYAYSQQTLMAGGYCKDPDVLRGFFDKMKHDAENETGRDKTFNLVLSQAIVHGNYDFVTFASQERPPEEFFQSVYPMINANHFLTPDKRKHGSGREQVLDAVLVFFRNHPKFWEKLYQQQKAMLFLLDEEIKGGKLQGYEKELHENEDMRHALFDCARRQESEKGFLFLCRFMTPKDKERYVGGLPNSRVLASFEQACALYTKNILTIALKPDERLSAPRKKI